MEEYIELQNGFYIYKEKSQYFLGIKIGVCSSDFPITEHIYRSLRRREGGKYTSLTEFEERC